MSDLPSTCVRGVSVWEETVFHVTVVHQQIPLCTKKQGADIMYLKIVLKTVNDLASNSFSTQQEYFLMHDVNSQAGCVHNIVLYCIRARGRKLFLSMYFENNVKMSRIIKKHYHKKVADANCYIYSCII